MAICLPSSVHASKPLLSLPPRVSRRSPVPSGLTTYTWEFRPPPGAMVTASQSPAGDHSALTAGSSPFVTIWGKPPPAGTIHTCGIPLRTEIKLTHLPSEEKSAPKALPIRAMRATDVASSAGAGFFNVAPEDGLAVWPGDRSPQQRIKIALAHRNQFMNASSRVVGNRSKPTAWRLSRQALALPSAESKFRLRANDSGEGRISAALRSETVLIRYLR